MKTITAILAFIVLSFSVALGGNENNIQKAISAKLGIPVELKNKKLDEKVNVSFKINSDGKTILMGVSTSNPELKKYILNEFPKIEFKNVAQNKEQLYFIDINFSVL